MAQKPIIKKGSSKQEVIKSCLTLMKQTGQIPSRATLLKIGISRDKVRSLFGNYTGLRDQLQQMDKELYNKCTNNSPLIVTRTNPMELVSSIIKKAAKQYKTKAHNVTSGQFWALAQSLITESQLERLGGFTNLREAFFPTPKAKDSYLLPRSSKFKPKKHILENFTVHEVDVKELFKLAKLGDEDTLKIVVQPDTHVPEHDPRAVNAFCEFLKHYKPHGIINLGDFLEMGSVSHWNAHSPSPRRLVPEVKIGKDILKKIDQAAGPQCILKRYIIGNHEDWIDQYLIEKIPEVLDGLEDIGPSLRIQDLLDLKNFGYKTVPLNEILQIGEAHFTHGIYTGVNHAKKHLDVFGVNIYYGHLHDVQSFSGVSVKGVHEAMSLGCMRSLNAPFLKGKPNNWSHAFGIFEFRKDGTFTRYSLIMVDGIFSFDGKTFNGNE